jgi:Cu2+-exporting ATPase
MGAHVAIEATAASDWLIHWGFVLSPAVGAVLMSASTIIVALNAQLLRRTQL